MYPQTVSQSVSSTCSEARVRAVLGKTLDDFVALAMSDHLSVAVASRWVEDLMFVLNHEAAERFQLRFDLPSGEQRAVDYLVSDDGSLLEDSESGGIDYRALPGGTSVSLIVRLHDSAPHRPRVLEYLRGRGWGTGTLVEGDGVRDRAYSKDGYGLIRRKIGSWE